MLQLHNLSPKHGAKHRVKRLGCGESSGHGKTSGRGHKGQRARSGGSVRIGFEGGQMPLHRRLPKRGFNNNAFKTVYAIVNLDQLEAFDVETPITEELLRQHGLVRGRVDGLKILGRGELTKPVKVVADHITARAKAEFERVGATFTLVSASKPAKIEVTQSA